MVFTSFQFVLVFLPLAYLGFVLAHRVAGWNGAVNALAFASLVFFGMWGAELLAVLAGSIIFNFAAGRFIAGRGEDRKTARLAMIAAITANLGLLGYLKYTNFFIDVLNQVTGAGYPHQTLMLSVGVSFFTFVQIGYLIDAYNGQLLSHNFGRYIVFSAFFPCVTAGPLVLQREVMEQLNDEYRRAFDLRRAIVGLTMFGMGMFKKLMLADSIAPYADQVFSAAQAGIVLDPLTSWTGSVSYALQLYFDFSGYSDMAIGLGILFGLRLPLNFDSPFKATNISDFWRRWHMTMTRFFTNYVYSGLALGGMRRAMERNLGPAGKFVFVAAIPSVVTFLVAGVWHGAGWTFVVYGLMHGVAIAVYLGWREFGGVKLPAAAGWALTMSTVVSALVIFRSPDLATAGALLGSMWNPMGLSAAAAPLAGFELSRAVSMIVLLGSVTLLLPNTQQILHHEWPTSDVKPEATALKAGLLAWRPALSSALVTAGTYTLALTSIGAGTGFLYYQF